MIPKFRAWDKQKKHFIDDFEIDREGTIFVRNFYCGLYYDTDFPVAVLMQSTGIKDKNGVDIFEGDILSYRYQNDDYLLNLIKEYDIKPDENNMYNLPEGVIDESLLDLTDYYEVKFQNTIPYVYSHKYKSMGMDDILLNGSGFEVVGNIFENKELLEENHEQHK